MPWSWPPRLPPGMVPQVPWCLMAEIGAGFNAPISGCDPTAHAETVRCGMPPPVWVIIGWLMLPVCDAGALHHVQAIVHSRISRLVYGAGNPRRRMESAQNAEEPHLNCRLSRSEECLNSAAAR